MTLVKLSVIEVTVNPAFFPTTWFTLFSRKYNIRSTLANISKPYTYVQIQTIFIGEQSVGFT